MRACGESSRRCDIRGTAALGGVNRSLIMFEDSLINPCERIVRPRVAIQKTFGAARPRASRREAQARA